MKAIITIIVLALVAWGAYALLNDDSTPVAETNQEQNDVSQKTSGTNNPADSTELATREFAINGTSFSFTPATMEVNQGERVRITFTNTGGTHDLVVEGYDVRTKVLQTGQSETIEFIANEAGTFEYYCSIGNHRQQGMEGTLVVR